MFSIHTDLFPNSDTYVYFQTVMVSRLQRALDALADWADLWQLSISFRKCSVLDIGKSTVPLDGLHICNNVLNVTRTNVDLGITVTDDLKPRAYIM